MSSNIMVYVSRLIVLLIAIPVHETAHAWVSYKLGDPTAKAMGRLTLNPIKHFDPMGAICMLVTGIGWAKPVPIDTRYYQNRKQGMALSALAGPVSNFIMAFLALIIARILIIVYSVTGGSTAVEYLYTIFWYMTIINISLGIFNLIPVPPFDGSRILLLFLPEKFYFGVMRYERYIFIGLFALLWTGILDKPLDIANDAVLNILIQLTKFVEPVARLLIH